MNPQVLQRLFREVYSNPMLIERRAGEAIELSLFNTFQLSETGFEKMIADNYKMTKTPVLTMMSPTTAKIDIQGAISRGLSRLEQFVFGGSDMDDVMDALTTVSNNPKIKTVMLNFDSPGGTLGGVLEVSSMIDQLRSSGVTVGAYASSLCASAAYWIAAQCDVIGISPTAQVGSIGVYVSIMDASAYFEKLGIKFNIISSGTYKAMGSPAKPLTDDQQELIQTRVNNLHAMFKAAVTDQRNGVDDGVMQGQCFMGDDAVEENLADEIVLSEDDFITKLWAVS